MTCHVIWVRDHENQMTMFQMLVRIMIHGDMTAANEKVQQTSNTTCSYWHHNKNNVYRHYTLKDIWLELCIMQ